MKYLPHKDSIEEEVFSVETWRDKKTGKITMEEWTDSEGQLHRDNAPASFTRDPETDVVCTERWYTRGKEHREDGPAVINRDRVTGSVTSSVWYRDGVKISSPRRSRRKVRGPETRPAP